MRHRLAIEHRAATVEDAAGGVVGLHGTDAAGVYLSALARMGDGELDDVARALYEDRTLLRLLAMRRTMFVVDRATAPVVHHAASLTVAAQERRKFLKFLTTANVADDVEAWLAEAEQVALAALRELGEATAPELAATDPRLATEIVLGVGTRNEARQKVAARVLLVLGAEGQVIRARPRGGWTSTQFRWAPIEQWCGDDALDMPEPAAADAELACRWLARFGPATAADLQWWTGWPAGRTRTALAATGAVEVDLDGEPGVGLADDLEPVPPPEPWVALLPALDATPMGYQRRDFYLGEHAERLFDVNGNVGPTVWCDGRIVGGWAQRPDGEVAVALLEDVGGEARAAAAAQAAALAERLGDVRLAPRARGYTPVERELLGR